MAPSRKFAPPLQIDTLPLAYVQPDHLSPALPSGVGSSSRRASGSASANASDDGGARRRTPIASPVLPSASGEKGSGLGSGGYFPPGPGATGLGLKAAPGVSLSPITTSHARPPHSTFRGLRTRISRMPIPPALRRWFTNPLIMGVTTICLLVLLYQTAPWAGYIFRIGPSPNPAVPGPFALPDDWIPPPPIPPGQLLDLPLLPEEYASYFGKLEIPHLLRNSALAPLGQKLRDFLGRPVWTHEEAAGRMEEGCPKEVADKLVNPDQLAGNLDFWKSVGVDDIRFRRAGIVRALERVVSQGYEVVGSKDMGGGRGIVLTGGNSDTTLRTLTLLRHLRHLNNDLPIEVFHYPGELTDENQRRELEDLGAEIREVQGVSKSPGAWKNFQIKGLALVQSKFREIIYMDSDNIPLRPLTSLFSSPRYLSTGAVFWPDLNKDHSHNAIWRIIGDVCSFDKWAFESGQMVIDKAGNGGLNLAALWIAAHMMSTGTVGAAGAGAGAGAGAAVDGEAGGGVGVGVAAGGGGASAGMDEREWWFHMCGGDKDTFRWAFRVLDIPWSDSPRWMSVVGFENGYDGGRFCGHTTLQYDLDIPHGSERELPLFVHSNLLKHMTPHGLGAHNTFTHIRRFKNDAYNNPSLNFAHGWVYHHFLRGMCLDFEWGPLAVQRVSPEGREGGVVTMKLEEVEGEPFEGFAQAFFEEGGRIGGW